MFQEYIKKEIERFEEKFYIDLNKSFPAIMYVDRTALPEDFETFLLTSLTNLAKFQLEEIRGSLPTDKDLANKLLRCFANKYPAKRHCAFIEEEICDACAEKI